MSAHPHSIALPAVVTVVTAVVLPAPSRAGETGAGPTTSTPACALERVGDRFVVCDVETGAGQPAPAHVAEWTPGSLR